MSVNDAETKALEALVKLLDSEEENVRLEAAKLILNRTHRV